MDSKYSILGNNENNNGNGNSVQMNGFQSKRKSQHINQNQNNNFESNNKKSKLGNNEVHDKGNNTATGDNNEQQQKLIMEQRKNLPVYNVRARLMQEIMNNPTLIIIGETGSGKSTQIPQYLSGYESIAVTQPRRVAAITIAKRVSHEMGCAVGAEVGYAVRFEEVTSKLTKIKYMTDGCLLREALSDRLLKRYRVIILDEAHERTINTDVLFGIVKEAQKTRYAKNMTPLKILIMSATMNVDRYAKYFNNCNVVYLDGRAFPIKVMNTVLPVTDYVEASLTTLFQIHTTAPANHDVLIFLTGQEEIEMAAFQIRRIIKSNIVNGPNLVVYTLYAQLPQHRQLDVFNTLQAGTRKVIISTNIAETSLTISGIRYVIDCGFVKQRSYDAVTGIDTLKNVRISQAQAWQRAGRAGRESDGTCYRTYTLTDFNGMQPSTTPEILRSNITTTLLQLLALEIDVHKFDFMDIPAKKSIDVGLDTLHQLGAINSVKALGLTDLGKKMAKFPLDARYSKIILESESYGCVDEILSIVAVLSGENIFFVPSEKREMALAMHAKFHSSDGDLLTILNVFRSFKKTDKQKMWCKDNYLNYTNLAHAEKVYLELLGIFFNCSGQTSSCGNNLDMVRKCLLTGLCNNIAELHSDRFYVTITNPRLVQLHPSSVLTLKELPKYIIFTEYITTNKTYLHYNSIIEADWISEILPNLQKRSIVSS